MMRLQRVGRRNDPSFRIVVTDKRTGPKSDKHVDRLGSYNPKLNQVQLDADKAKEWLAKGVQPSDTMHNILVSEKVIKADKINVLPRKSPVVSEEPEKNGEAEAPTEGSVDVEEPDTTESETADEEVSEDAPAEEEKPTEAPVEEAKEEAPVEEKTEEAKEEDKKEE